MACTKLDKTPRTFRMGTSMTPQDPNFAWRSRTVSDFCVNARAHLLPLDGPISHDAYTELRALQIELDNMVTRCRNHLGITGVKHATSGMRTQKTDQLRGGAVSSCLTVSAADVRKNHGMPTRPT